MFKNTRLLMLGLFAVLSCTAYFCVEAEAETVEAVGSYKPGPGDHYDKYGNIVSLSGEILVDAGGNVIKGSGGENASVTDTPSLPDGNAPSGGCNYTVYEENGETYYTFEGKTYTLGEYMGEHKISGYSGEELGSCSTTSGSDAAARHTLAASSSFPLGSVVIIMGVSGPGYSAYDGMYVVEDRGGYYVESEGWLDIYFDTYAEADATTASGWNYAKAWIAEPVNE